MNAGSVIGIPLVGGVTKTLIYAKEFALFALTGGGMQKLWA